MLFISTDLPFASSIGVKDVTLYCDDQAIPVEKPVVMADDAGNLYIEILNIYNQDTTVMDCAMPTDSFRIEFTLNGVTSVIG